MMRGFCDRRMLHMGMDHGNAAYTTTHHHRAQHTWQHVHVMLHVVVRM